MSELIGAIVAVFSTVLLPLAIGAMFNPRRWRPRAPGPSYISYGGPWPFKKNANGQWVHKKTGRIAKSYTLKEFLDDRHD